MTNINVGAPGRSIDGEESNASEVLLKAIQKAAEFGFKPLEQSGWSRSPPERLARASPRRRRRTLSRRSTMRLPRSRKRLGRIGRTPRDRSAPSGIHVSVDPVATSTVKVLVPVEAVSVTGT